MEGERGGVVTESRAVVRVVVAEPHDGGGEKERGVCRGRVGGGGAARLCARRAKRRPRGFYEGRRRTGTDR